MLAWDKNNTLRAGRRACGCYDAPSRRVATWEEGAPRFYYLQAVREEVYEPVKNVQLPEARN